MAHASTASAPLPRREAGEAAEARPGARALFADSAAEQSERGAGGPLSIQAALAVESRRHLRAASRVRVVCAAAFFAVCAAIAWHTGDQGWRVYLLPLGGYLLLSAILALPQAAVKAAALPAALADVLLVFLVQRSALPVSEFPAGVAGFSLGLFAMVVALNAPSLGALPLAVATSAAAVAQCALMAQASVGAPAMATALLVLALHAWACHAIARHARDLALRLARAQLAEKLQEGRAHEELAARATIERMLAKERELHGKFRAVVEEAARQQQLRAHVEKKRLEVLEAIGRNAPLPETLQHLLGVLEARWPDAGCALLLKRGVSFVLEASRGLPEALQGERIGIALGGTHLGPAALASGAVAALHLSRDLPAAAEAGFAAGWCKAFGTPGGLELGGALLLLREAAAPQPDDRAVFQVVAQLASLAVERAALAARLLHQAEHDALTSMPNRRKLDAELRQALWLAHQKLEPLAVAYIDLDRFKAVNDGLGHPTGDLLLIQVAARLQAALGAGDLIARMGGDEFAVLFPRASGPQAAARATALLAALSAPFEVEGRELFVSGCAGIAAYPDDGQDGPTLLRNADAALYAAKRRGMGLVECVRPEILAASRESLELEMDLRRALERGELAVVFQEQVTRAGRVEAVEALVRWRHPRHGDLPPARFVKVAEEAGMIGMLGSFVLDEALRTLAGWRDEGLPPVRMAVNISGLELRDPSFPERTLVACARAGVDPHDLELEVTESVLSDAPDVVARLSRLRGAGVAIAIDDFGTGYSSLGYLQRLPIDTVKIDRAFVERLGSDASRAPLVRAIVELSHGLGLRVVAEGVETEVQHAALAALGCDLLQGFRFGGAPRPARLQAQRLQKGGHMGGERA